MTLQQNRVTNYLTIAIKIFFFIETITWQRCISSKHDAKRFLINLSVVTMDRGSTINCSSFLKVSFNRAARF